MQIFKKIYLLNFLLLSLFLPTSCMHSSVRGAYNDQQASTSQETSSNDTDYGDVGEDDSDTHDPFEPVNRFIFGFNRAVDTVILKPVAKGYTELLPDQVQHSVRNFLHNLKSPLTFANHVLQGEFKYAANTVSRFVVNTTVGIGGLFDVADHMGVKYQPADFGQTLGVWGVPAGPYLMLPIIGPSSVRDGIGLAADTMGDPLTLYAHNTDRDWINYTRAGMTLVDTRAEFLPVTDDLEKNSLDYYAALRSMYQQRREAFVKNKNSSDASGIGSGSSSSSVDYPEYPEYND